ncbi:MAG: sulfite exporter TauE/SafE family protein [Alphaproteobacteria bacterium]
MHIYLPIAELSINIFVLLGLGFGVGLLTGVFGVGGGFLLTPLLIFIGVPPPVAVGTTANQIVASSVSGMVAQLRRGNVDIKMGLVMMAGGFVGSWIGIWLFGLLQGLGQIDLVIQLSYVVLLGTVGGLMGVEAARTILRQRRGRPERRLHEHTWLHGLPFKIRFRRSRLYISAVLPIGLGLLVGMVASVLGAGGGFFALPAMIYLIGMPSSIVVGTSLFQITFVAANVTFLQAVTNNSVDVVLAFILLVGGVIGAQFGSRWAIRLPGEQLRGLLAALILGIALKLGFDLVATPNDLYTVSVVVAG